MLTAHSSASRPTKRQRLDSAPPEGPSEPHLTPSPRKRQSSTPRTPPKKIISSYFFTSPYYASGNVGFTSPSLSPTRHHHIHNLASTPTFYGLIQEQLAPDVWKLLVSVILLNQTRGVVAIPVLWEVLLRWPCAEAMVEADEAELASVLRPVGIHRVRARRVIELSRAFLNDPPVEERVHRSRVIRRHLSEGQREEMYPPTPISHLPGIGRYALDSWRIFVADGGARKGLRGEVPRGREVQLVQRAEEEWWRRRGRGYRQSEAGLAQGSEQHLLGWRTVMPLDKELRAYLVWRWGVEGKQWDPERGIVAATDPTVSHPIEDAIDEEHIDKLV